MADPRYASRFVISMPLTSMTRSSASTGSTSSARTARESATIDGFVVDAAARRVNHIVVDSGGWFTSATAAPPDRPRRGRPRTGNLYAPMSRVMHCAGYPSSMPIASRRSPTRSFTPSSATPRSRAAPTSPSKRSRPRPGGTSAAPLPAAGVVAIGALRAGAAAVDRQRVRVACSADRLASVTGRARLATGLAQDLFGDGLELQVRGALVDLPDLRVAVELLDRVLLDEAVAAEQVHGERRDALCDLRRQDLADRRFGEERLAGVAQARGVVDRQPRRLDLDGRARDLVLDGLELGDRLAELLPLLDVARSSRRARRAPGRSSARRCRSALRSASRWRPCSPCRSRRARSPAARGSPRGSARTCCSPGCPACLPSCRR